MNSTTVLLPLFVTHRSPEGPKARPDGLSRLPPVAERIAAGVGEPLTAKLGRGELDHGVVGVVRHPQVARGAEGQAGWLVQAPTSRRKGSRPA